MIIVDDDVSAASETPRVTALYATEDQFHALSALSHRLENVEPAPLLNRGNQENRPKIAK